MQQGIIEVVNLEVLVIVECVFGWDELLVRYYEHKMSNRDIGNIDIGNIASSSCK